MFVAAQSREWWQMEHSQSSEKYREKYQGEPGKCCQAAMTSACNPCQPPSTTSTVPDRHSAKGHHSLPVKALCTRPTLKVVFPTPPPSLQERILTTWHLMLNMQLICLSEQNIQHFRWIPFFLPCSVTPLNFACFLPSLLKGWRLPFWWLDCPHHSLVCSLMPLGCSHSCNCFLRLLLRGYIISELLSKESVTVGVRRMRKLVAN